MTGEPFFPLGAEASSFPWGTPEADVVLAYIANLQMSSGILQVWHRQQSAFNNRTHQIEQLLREKGLTRDTRSIDTVMAGARIALSAEAALIATKFAVSLGEERKVIRDHWGLIKVDPRTGLQVGDALSFHVRFGEIPDGEELNAELTDEQVSTMAEQIELQRQTGIFCRS